METVKCAFTQLVANLNINNFLIWNLALERAIAQTVKLIVVFAVALFLIVIMNAPTSQKPSMKLYKISTVPEFA